MSWLNRPWWEREEREGRKIGARRDVIFTGRGQRDQGDMRVGATDITHVAPAEHFPRGRSAKNGKATVRAAGEGANPRAHSEEASNSTTWYQ
jgi:hypothetical protein